MKLIYFYFRVLTICSFPILVYGQNKSTYLKVYEAEAIYRSKQNLELAVDLYQTAFLIPPCNGSKVLDAISCATSINNLEASVAFMKIGLSIGLTPEDYRNLWSSIGNGASYPQLIHQCDTTNLIKQYHQNLDLNMIDFISKLVEADQEVRSRSEENTHDQLLVDQANFAALKIVFEKKGRLPYYSELGLDGSDDLELLFIHMDKSSIEFFLPAVIQSIKNNHLDIGETILYQLERNGMSESKVYTISDDLKIVGLGKRSLMDNGHYCQNFGEWFNEKSKDGKTIYRTPLDPNIEIKEVNRIRNLLGLDDFESKQKREPWVKNVTVKEFTLNVPANP